MIEKRTLKVLRATSRKYVNLYKLYNPHDLIILQNPRFEKIFDKLDNQIKYLNPKYLLPFASYSWFSHEENIHLNQGQITVREFVDTYSNKEIIPLFLDEEWEVGQKHDVQKSMSKWANILDSPKVCTPVEMPVSYDELLNQFNKMFSELNDHNDMISLRLDDTFRATVIELTDYPANENKIINKEKDKIG